METKELKPAEPKPQGVVIKEDIPNKTTKDLELAAALHVEGCRFLDINKEDPKRQVFIFAGGELADKVERDFYAGLAIGSYSAYAASLRRMKSLIHN